MTEPNDPSQQYPTQQYPTQQYPTQQTYPGRPQQFSTPPPPPSNVGWAVAAVVFFWPVAFSAFTHALNVFPKWSIGDYAGAQHASDQAKRLGKISLLIFGVCIVLLVLFYIVLIVALINGADDVNHSSDW